MLNLEVAVIQLPRNIKEKLDFITQSTTTISDIPMKVFNEEGLDFLSDLSKQILSNKNIREYPDVATFAFWCRNSNLKKIIKNSLTNHIRVGLGLVYHNSPSNVPINFAYSLAFGILSGNCSVIRLSSKETISASFTLNILNELLTLDKYKNLKKNINIIKFEHNDEVNSYWMSHADARIIWGGDETVAKMRSYKSKPRSREIVFPDRYSMSVLKADKIIDTSRSEMEKICENLFNDIYVMNQQACSSPQLFNWVGHKKNIDKAKDKLWTEFFSYVETRHELEPIEYMDKYIDLCKSAMLNNNIKKINRTNNLLYNIELSHFNDNQHLQRGYFGTIHEISINSIHELSSIVDSRYQTLTYFGFDRKEIEEFVFLNNLRGIDRIVPLGRSMDMDVIWDGYDIINHLSRIIDIY